MFGVFTGMLRQQVLLNKAIIWKMAVKLPLIILIYTISQFLKHRWNTEWISFPMMYHTVLYTLYSACASQFNNIPILVTMVTSIFPPNGFHGKQNHVTYQRYHYWPKCQIWWRFVLNWQNYSHKLLYSIIVSIKTLILP